MYMRISQKGQKKMWYTSDSEGLRNKEKKSMPLDEVSVNAVILENLH